jgi:hypothetical protein
LLLLLRFEQLLELIQVVEEWTDGGGARLPYPCSQLNDEVGDDSRQFTFLPPFNAPKIVLPMVTVIRFGFSGYKIGTRNASTRL